MFVAKVTGSVVATQKVETMVGHKLLVVEPYRLDPNDRDGLVTTGRVLVAVDTVGAGEGEFVLITQGSSARLDAGNQEPAGRHRDHRHRRHGPRRADVRLRREDRTSSSRHHGASPNNASTETNPCKPLKN